jgi:hypothetical protein
MKRIREIIAEIRERYPRDEFFSNFETSCRNIPEKKNSYCIYNGALMLLDNESWQILKCKALEHYMDHREGQKKQGFFNQLNEAFAYRYLVRQGFKDVRFIEENKKKSPDIRYSVHNTQSYCEVKTLGISDDQINRRNTMAVSDGSDYEILKNGFLKKFHDAICTAKQQLCAFGSNGLVYIIINFDDGTLDYYQNYKKQLIAFSESHGFSNLFIKIGLRGNKSICITSG